MESARVVITVSDLIQRNSPLSGAFSLSSPSQSNSKPSQPSSSTSLSNQNPNPKHKILRSLDHPAILIGTITLPIHDGDRSASNSILRCPSSTCLLFSDESSTICCDVIDIDIRVIGRRKIRVLAWNFIPFNHRGGFLEIIRWSLADSSLGLVPCSHIDSIPLCFNSDTDDECKSRARYRTYGLLDSVSPVSNVPSSMGGYSGGSNTLCGFLGQLRVCECKLCNSLKASGTPLIKECSQHSFSKSVLLYFCGSASSWHPIISKMVGSIVLVSGLKKKLVFIGKELSRTMLVTAEKSMLHIPKLINNFPPKENTTIEGKGELGLFLGVVTGIYMQGMVVELDKEVFLLMTNQLLTQLPGLRVGTLLCMRNVHFVKPRFTWTKLLILGACVKTSITVQCFSPLEAWCNTVPQWQSLLGKFIKSLEFSARLWVLLVISCFRKKFSGILSEKDILGSKHVITCFVL